MWCYFYVFLWVELIVKKWYNDERKCDYSVINDIEVGMTG